MSTGENNAPSSDHPQDGLAGQAAAADDSLGTTDSKSPVTRPVKVTRGLGPLAARGLGIAKPASPSVSAEKLEQAVNKPQKKQQQPSAPRPPRDGEPSIDKAATPARPAERSAPRKVAVPSTRGKLSDDVQAELDAALESADIESLLGGTAGMPDRTEPLDDGAQVHAIVLKIHQDTVFVGLGGPDEGAIPLVQFKQEPVIGWSLDVIVRGLSSEDGLYQCSLPGGTIEVSQWEDIAEGSVVDATITGSNAGGLECKVGGIKGFIPISQISEYRVEDTSEFVGQKFTCIVTESSQRRGNLVLSRRGVLEREREEKKKQQLEQLEAGVQMEGIVRSIKDFGAFVDLGGVDGLIHISKLSWDRVQHPSEVLEIGQRITVQIDSIDKETGKLSLSYRDLLENPWDTAQAEFTVNSVHKGIVSKIAAFGCFVRLAPGIEGLVHISELAHHRVSRVDSLVSEGQEVEVKVLSFDREAQKISLSIKAAQQVAVADPATSDAEEPDQPPRQPDVKPTHVGPLKGGTTRDAGGAKFGLRW